MTIPTAAPPSAEEEREFVSKLAAARGGDRVALGHLFSAARVYLVNIADAELEQVLRTKGSGSDVVQDALAEAQQILARFNGSRFEEFLAWLRAILLNKLADFRRHYFRTQMRRVDRERPIEPETTGGGMQLAGSGATPSAEVVRAEEERLLAEALSRLPEHYRQAIAWRNFEGLAFGEIGRRLGKTEDAARMLWGRAIELLRQELERPQ